MEKGWQAACEYKNKEIMNEVRQTPSGVSVVKFNKELVRKQIEKLQAENKKLREALGFYALWSNWGGDVRMGSEIISDDCDYIDKWYEYVGGKRAREALKVVIEEL